MKIFLDDLREAPDNTWKTVRSAAEFMAEWSQAMQEITHISFDHDLGDVNDPRTGYDCVCAVELSLHMGKIAVLPVMTVHSDNGPGRHNILRAIFSMQRYMNRNTTFMKGEI